MINEQTFQLKIGTDLFNGYKEFQYGYKVKVNIISVKYT